MAMAAKCLCFFIAVCLVISLASSAQMEEECKKVYEGYETMGCFVRIYPSLCYIDCKREKGAKSGQCRETDGQYQCICDYCSDPFYGLSTTHYPTILQNVV